MRTIYKFELPIKDEVEIMVPPHSHIISVGHQRKYQDEKVFIWIALDNEVEPTQKRTFRVIGTGHPIEDYPYLIPVGSVHLYDGSLVFHIFEKTVLEDK